MNKNPEKKLSNLIKSTASEHQEDALKFLSGKNNCGLLRHDTGTGKTFTALAYSVLLAQKIQKETGQKAKGIIFCRSSILPNWNEELEKHLIIPVRKKIYNFSSAKKSMNITKKGEFLLENDYGIYIAGSSYLRNSNFVDAVNKKKFDFLIVDESHDFKSFKAQQSKGLISISKNIPNRVLMTGSPLLNDLQDIWTQIEVVAPGKLKPTYWAFLKTYFFDSNSWMKEPGQDPETRKKYFPNYIVHDSKKDELLKILDSVMHVAKKEDCLDLPEFCRQVVYTSMDAKTKQDYDLMLKTLKSELEGEEISAKNQLVMLMRLQQIIAFSKCKQELCLETLKEIDLSRHKIIIWCNFPKALIRLQEFIEKNLPQHRSLIAHGGVDKNQRFELINKFDNEESVRILFATQGALSTGFNIIKADYSYYHSKDYRFEHDHQSEGRNYRRGSHIHKRVTRIDGIVTRTIDEAIHKALKRKKGLHDMAKDIKGFLYDD